MSPIAIIVVFASVSFVSAVLAVYIKKRIKGEPTGECACCHKGTKKMLKQYHKMYSK